MNFEKSANIIIICRDYFNIMFRILFRLEIIRNIIGILYIIFDTISIGISNNNHSNKILIVRLDRIGDFILWLSAARKISEFYEKYEIIIIVNKAVTELACELPFFDSVYEVDEDKFLKNIFYRFRKLREVKNLNVRITIQPTFSRVLLTGDSIVRASGALKRIGFSSDLSNMTNALKLYSNRWYTKLIPGNPNVVSELDRNLDFIKKLMKLKHLNLPAPSLPSFKTLSLSEVHNQKYFVISPSASTKVRMWPAENFSSCGIYLQKLTGWMIVLCGSDKDKLLCQMIQEQINSSNVMNLAGKTNLIELAELVRGAQFLISNDTLFAHLAPAVNTPSVCILGGGHYGRFFPYPSSYSGTKPIAVVHEMDCFGCNWFCIYEHPKDAPVPCIRNVSLSKVINEVKKLITMEKITPIDIKCL